MKNLIIACVICFGSMSMWGQSIIVNDPNDPETSLTAEELIEQVLIGSSCADVTVTALAENPAGTTNLSQRSWGYFKDGGSLFPFPEGIILSTGFAVSAEGPNDSTGSSDSGVGWAGDIDMQTLLDNEYGTVVGTNNATVFEFTFVSNQTEISFDFIFASEEYENQFECSDTFRDGFAFLIKGPGIPDDSGAPFGGINIGSVPGSMNVPVSTASIHADTFLCGFEVLGVNFFPEFYVSNSGPNNNDETQFDGRTEFLTTSNIPLQIGETYTVKLVIADRGDTAFDSAVFMRSDSFSLSGVELGPDVQVCDDTSTVLMADLIGIDPALATFEWFKDGVLIPGENMQTLTVTDDALYTVEVTEDGCTQSDDTSVAFRLTAEFDLGADFESCFVIGETVQLDATPSNVNVADLTFEWSLDGNILVGETMPTLDATQTGTYMVTVSNDFCVATDTIVITPATFEVDLGDDVQSCLNNPETLTASLTVYTAAEVTFEWLLDGNVIPGETMQTLMVTQPGTYQVNVMAGECMESDSIVVSPGNDIDIDLGANFDSCFLMPETLDASPSNYDPADANYQWSLNGTVLAGETNATLEATEPGLYEVLVTIGVCEATDSITIDLGEFEVELGDDFSSCFDNSAILTATITNFDPMDTSFQWFLDGVEITGQTDISIPITGEGTYSVIATAGSCTATDEINISLRTDFEIMIVEDDFKTCPNEPNILTAVTDEENVTFQWFKNGVLIPGAEDRTLEFVLGPDEDGVQTFSVEISLGDCFASDDIDVELYGVDNCVISQGISPNSDGFNDILDLEFLSDRAGGINDFKIYNRYGALVFEQTNYVNEWFGQSDDGEELPTGTYYVILTLNNEDPIYGNQYAAWIYLNREAN